MRTSTQKPSQLSLFCKVLLPLLSLHIFATISLDFLVGATSCHILPRHATTGPFLAGWISIKWRGLTSHLHHKTLLLCGRAEELEQQGSGQNSTSSTIPSQSFTSLLPIATIPLDFLVWATSCHILPRHATTGPLLADFLYYPFTIFHIFATCCQLLPSLLTSWFGQPRATSCHDMPRLGPCWQGVSIKWRGLTPHLHHKQGWISIKWRGLTPHLYHNTVALWERAEELEQQGSEPVLRSHLSSHSSANFYFLYYPFTSLLPSLLTSWFGQPPATSCHDWALSAYYRSLCLVCWCSFSIE